jgi:type I restriction enzyme S subunit
VSWPLVPVSDFCQTGSGGTPSRNQPEFYEGSIPWIKSGDLKEKIVEQATEFISDLAIQKSSAKMIPKGAILLAMYGATVGRMAMLGIDATTNQAVCSIVPDKSKAFPKYVYYALLSKVPEFLRNAVGGAQPNISQGIIKETKIPLPPLTEQKRIAAILDKADAIRRKRQQAIQLADDFLRAVFLDMFGDPVTNPKGWEVKKFAEIGTLDRGKSKHRPRNEPKLLGGSHPLIQTGDVANSKGYITSYKSTYSDLGLEQSRKWSAGTLCITIAANIAKTGILTFDACFPDSVVGFKPNEQATTEYVQAWIGFLQKILEANAPESAQKNINLAILRDLDIPLPPLSLQDKYSEIVASIVSLNGKLDSGVCVNGEFFNSLSQKAFAGQL